MYRQTVKPRKIKAVRGILIVLGVLAAAYLGNLFFSMLIERIGNIASYMFLAYGCCIAWIMLRVFAAGYVFATDGNVLRISRIYGKRERFICDIWLHNVKAFGEPETVKAKLPGAKLIRTLRKDCPYEPFALAWTDEGKSVVSIFQPDDELRGRILQILK